MREYANWIIVAVGIFSVAGGVLNWDWFMESRRGRRMVRLFGRQGARIFYILLGILIASLGIALEYGLLRSKN